MEYINGKMDYRGRKNNLIDLTGKVFGRLTVLSRASEYGVRPVKWLCQCSCDKATVVTKVSEGLRKNKIPSCGCAKKGPRPGSKCHTRLYKKYLGMKTRCFNTKDPGYRNYGGRGITVCDEWKGSFSSFKEWAEANGYKNGLSLERVDVNGNYCPENCCWIPLEDQVHNKRTSHIVHWEGRNWTVAQLNRHLGFPKALLRKRLWRGIPLERAVIREDLSPHWRRMTDDSIE